MAPKRQAKKAAAPSRRRGSTSSESQENAMSQSQSFDPQQMVEAMKKKNEQRKHQQKQQEKKMLEAHKTAMSQWREEAETIFEEYQRQIQAIERAKMKRLISLLRRKRELKDQMDQSLAVMERAYRTASRRVCVAVEHRMRQLSVTD